MLFLCLARTRAEAEFDRQDLESSQIDLERRRRVLAIDRLLVLDD